MLADIPEDLQNIKVGMIDFMNYISACISKVENKKCIVIYKPCNCCQEFTRDDGDWVHHQIGEMGFIFNGLTIFLETLELSTESGQGYGETTKSIIANNNDPYNQKQTSSICSNITFSQLYEFFKPLYVQFPYISDFLFQVISEIQIKRTKGTVKNNQTPSKKPNVVIRRSILFPEEVDEIIGDILVDIAKGEYGYGYAKTDVS